MGKIRVTLDKTNRFLWWVILFMVGFNTGLFYGERIALRRLERAVDASMEIICHHTACLRDDGLIVMEKLKKIIEAEKRGY